MFNLCQSKQIIHQHHHHYYQIIIDPLKSKTLTPQSQPQQHDDDLILDKFIDTSKLYSIKSRYKSGRQKGIQLSFKEESQHIQDMIKIDNKGVPQQMNVNGVKTNKNRRFRIFRQNNRGYEDIDHKDMDMAIYNQRQNNHQKEYNNVVQNLKNHNKINHNINHKINNNNHKINNNSYSHSDTYHTIYNNSSNISSQIMKSNQKPSSRDTSLTQTLKIYKNQHQLQTSKVNIKKKQKKNHSKSDDKSIDKSINQSIDKIIDKCIDNDKKHNIIIPKQKLKANKHNLSLNYQSLPSKKPIKQDLSINPKITISHPMTQSQQLTKNNTTISLKTRKQNISSKKISLFQDAKSITSNQNNLTKSIAIQQSLILTHQLDYFQVITPDISHTYYDTCLAIDKSLGFMVSLKIYQQKHEYISLNQLQMISYIQKINKKDLNNCIVQLYKVLIDRSNFQKIILFINQPYQTNLDCFILKNRQLINRNNIFYYQLLKEIEYQLKNIFKVLECNRIYLNSSLKLNDIVIINQKYKINSLYKLSYDDKMDGYDIQKIIKGIKIEISNRLNQTICHYGFIQ